MVHQFIPDDLLYIVLSKLPVKSLLQLRSVSKLWLKIIDSSYFINMHLTQTAKTCSNTIILPYKLNDGCHIRPMYAFDFNKSMDKAKKIEPPLLYDSIHKLTCNGLISLSTDDTVIIWNPSTHKHRVVDKVKGDDGWSCPYYSFGYDHKTDDYKVVMLENAKENKGFIVHIYSLKTGSWRKNTGIANREILKGTPYMSVYVGGFIYWMDDYVVRLEEPFVSKNRIVSFDLTTEKWLPLTMPPELLEIPSTYQNWSLSNHHESLYASCSDMKTHIVDLWVMKKSCTWTKLATIKGGCYCTKITPLWSFKKTSRHQLLFFDMETHKLYDIEEEPKEVVDVHNVHDDVSGIMESFICYETLVPV